MKLPAGPGPIRAHLLEAEIDMAVADLACTQRFVGPLFERAARRLASHLGSRCGVTSLYTSSWHLRTPQ